MCNWQVRSVSSVCSGLYRSELGRGAAVPDWQAGNYFIIRHHRRVHGRAIPYKDAKYWGGHQQHSGPTRSHAGAIRAASGESAHCALRTHVIFTFQRRCFKQDTLSVAGRPKQSVREFPVLFLSKTRSRPKARLWGVSDVPRHTLMSCLNKKWLWILI